MNEEMENQANELSIWLVCLSFFAGAIYIVVKHEAYFTGLNMLLFSSYIFSVLRNIIKKSNVIYFIIVVMLSVSLAIEKGVTFRLIVGIGFIMSALYYLHYKVLQAKR